MSGSFGSSEIASWDWWSEIVRHSSEPLVYDALHYQAEEGDKYRIPAMISLIHTEEDRLTALNSVLAALVDGGDTEIRNIVFMLPYALKELGDVELIEPVYTVYNSDYGKQLVFNMIINFPENESALEYLKLGLRDMDEDVRGAALGSINQIFRENPDAYNIDELAETVVDLMDDEAQYVSNLAIWLAVSHLDNQLIFNGLDNLLKQNRTPEKRLTLVHALERVAESEPRTQLLRIAAEDNGQDVRDEARRILYAKLKSEMIILSVILSLIIVLAFIVFLCVKTQIQMKRYKAQGNIKH